MLGLERPCIRLVIADLAMIFKLLHNQYYQIDSKKLVQLAEIRHRGHEYKLVKQRCNTTVRQNFLILRMTNLWNRLPENVVKSKTVKSFKVALKRQCHGLITDYIANEWPQMWNIGGDLH